MAAKQLSDGAADGTVLGQSTTDKVGFYGVAPVARPLASTAGALTAGSTTAADVAAAFVDLRTQLVNLGLIRTS
jgi:hypothetical protein